MSRFKFFCLIFLSAIGQLSAQTLFFNNGANIHIQNGGLVAVKTASAENVSGVIHNAGTMIVEGDLINNNELNGAGVSTGLYRVQGNWENNNQFNADQSTVELYGGNQLITGLASTTFYNLNLQGGNSVKTQTINAQTRGQLLLNDAELATGQFEMLVTNPSISAIQRNNGFVSSEGVGKLSRTTNIASTYFYPIGTPSSLGISLYRPVVFVPSGASVNTYGACVVGGNASVEGYNVTVLDDILCQVNPSFWHKLYHDQGNLAADLRMYYDPITDGEWSQIGHWKTNNQWNYTVPATTGANGPFKILQIDNYADFSPEPFALANARLFVDAGPDLDVSQGETVQITASVVGGVPSAISWTPTDYLDCTDCAQVNATPADEITYYVEVTGVPGCTTIDSVKITVSGKELIMPTAFSPNGDGKNDVFRTLSKNLKVFNLKVWNRWGEKVFETDNPAVGWNGVFRGAEQEVGTYVWNCTYQFSGDSDEQLGKGDVTLLR